MIITLLMILSMVSEKQPLQSGLATRLYQNVFDPSLLSGFSHAPKDPIRTFEDSYSVAPSTVAAMRYREVYGVPPPESCSGCRFVSKAPTSWQL